MNNLAQRYDRPVHDCCTAAEQLINRIVRMDTHRLEIAYQRLTELLDRARARRVATVLRACP